MNIMQEMQKIRPEIVPTCRKSTVFRGGRNVDIVGVTGSIPVTPTIQAVDNAKFSGFLSYCLLGSTNLEGGR